MGQIRENRENLVLQWNPSITDTVGDQSFVRYSSGASGIFPVGVV